MESISRKASLARLPSIEREYDSVFSDAVGLLSFTIRGELVHVDGIVKDLENIGHQLTHEVVSEFYSWLEEILGNIEGCVKCLFDVALPYVNNLKKEDRQLRNQACLFMMECIPTVIDSQLAFQEGSHPPGERFIVIKRCRDILCSELMQTLVDIEKQVEEAGRRYREETVGCVERDVYFALGEVLMSRKAQSKASKWKGSWKANEHCHGVMVQWMTDQEIYGFSSKIGLTRKATKKLFLTRLALRDARQKNALSFANSVEKEEKKGLCEGGRLSEVMTMQLNAIAVERLKGDLNAGVTAEDMRNLVQPTGQVIDIVALTGKFEGGDRPRVGPSNTDSLQENRLMLGTWKVDNITGGESEEVNQSDEENKVQKPDDDRPPSDAGKRRQLSFSAAVRSISNGKRPSTSAQRSPSSAQCSHSNARRALPFAKRSLSDSNGEPAEQQSRLRRSASFIFRKRSSAVSDSETTESTACQGVSVEKSVSFVK